MLDVVDVSIRFAERAVLDNVSLHVDDGEIVAILGPSGAGKSTLLRIVAGLLQPDSGRVLLDGVDITDRPAHVRNIGMMFQDEQLFPHLDVAANVAFGPRMHRWPAAQIAARVDELLDHRRARRLQSSTGRPAQRRREEAGRPGPIAGAAAEPCCCSTNH